MNNLQINIFVLDEYFFIQHSLNFHFYLHIYIRFIVNLEVAWECDSTFSWARVL